VNGRQFLRATLAGVVFAGGFGGYFATQSEARVLPDASAHAVAMPGTPHPVVPKKLRDRCPGEYLGVVPVRTTKVNRAGEHWASVWLQMSKAGAATFVGRSHSMKAVVRVPVCLPVDRIDGPNEPFQAGSPVYVLTHDILDPASPSHAVRVFFDGKHLSVER
jgi:hypothetical protein